MKLHKTRTVTKTIEIESDIICDICGLSCVKKRFGTPNEEVIIGECMELKANWGYNSGKDLEHWTAEVCESCVDEHLVPLINFNKPYKTIDEKKRFERKFKINRLNKNDT